MFHISLLEHDTIRKEQIDENMTKLEFDTGDNEEYKVEIIKDSAVYAKKSEGHLLSLYYLVA